MALLQQGVELLTPLRKNMKQHLVRLNDKLLRRLSGADRNDQRSIKEHLAD
jgi:hypothetical protein